MLPAAAYHVNYRIPLARACTVTENHQTDLLISSMLDVTSTSAGCSRKETLTLEPSEDCQQQSGPS